MQSRDPPDPLPIMLPLPPLFVQFLKQLHKLVLVVVVVEPIPPKFELVLPAPVPFVLPAAAVIHEHYKEFFSTSDIEASEAIVVLNGLTV